MGLITYKHGFHLDFVYFTTKWGRWSQLLKKKQWMRWVTWADPQNGEGSKRLKLRALFIQSSFEECFSVRIFIHQPFHGALNRKPPNFSSDPWLKFDIPHALIVSCFVLVQSFRSIIYASIEGFWSCLFKVVLWTLPFWESKIESIHVSKKNLIVFA